MKIIISIICLSLSLTIYCNFASAQTFSQIGQGFNHSVKSITVDSITGDLYAGGNFTALATGENMQHVSKFNGSSWDSLAGGTGTTYSVNYFNGDIFVGGGTNQYDTNSFRGLAFWNGQWQSIGDVIYRGGSGGVREVKTLNNELYVMGTIDSVNNIAASKIAKWDGSQWHTFPVLDSTGGGYCILTCALYNNELYVGGQFQGQGANNLKDIAKFDGSNWVNVGGGLSGSGYVGEMIIYKNELYVAGSFQTANGDPGNGIIKWNGTSWSSLGSGTNAWVSGLAIMNDELYVSGTFTEAGGIPVTYLAKWDGIQWHDVGGNFNYMIESIASFNNELYLGGYFTEINNTSIIRIAKYTAPVSVHELSYENLNVYPTLSSGKIYISDKTHFNNKLRIEIFNVNGVVVFIDNPNNISDNYEIDLSPYLKPGIYDIRLISEGKVKNQKIIFTLNEKN